MLPVVLAAVNDVTLVPTKVPLKPAAPATVTPVKAALEADKVNTPVPEMFKVRRAVSVMPPNVVAAVKAALTVTNWLLASVITPKEPPPRFRARVVFAAAVAVEPPSVMPNVPPVPDKLSVRSAVEVIVDVP